MFGGMTISPVLKINPTDPLDAAVAALLRVAEDPVIVKWIEFPNSLLLFAMVPDNLQSGAIYCLDRKRGLWYAIDFDDQEYGGHNLKQFQELLEECGFLRLVERPGLLCNGLPWRLEMSKAPEARV